MQKPTLSGEQGKYIVHLEKIIKQYESKKTIVNSYFALKKIVDDLNEMIIGGMDVPVDGGGFEKMDIISYPSLSSKDDKVMDRLFKFIDALPKYNSSLKAMEIEFAPEIKEEEEDFGGVLEQVILGNVK